MQKFSLERSKTNPVIYSHLERLEALFATSPAVMKGACLFLEIFDKEQKDAALKLFRNYNITVSPQTAAAYAATVKRNQMIDEDGGVVVLVSRDHPALFAENIKQLCGKSPVIPANILAVLEKIRLKKLLNR